MMDCTAAAPAWAAAWFGLALMSSVVPQSFAVETSGTITNERTGAT